MGYSNENGYTPVTIEDILTSIMGGINTQFGTSYTIETFEGTGFYKYFYALAQRIQTNEVKTSEIFLKVQDYFDFTNETILEPKVTPNGIIGALLLEGYRASVKPPLDADAGKAYICVDVDDADDDYADIKLEICTLLSQYVVAGVITQGTETESIVLSNGQSFDFKFHLPDRIEAWLRLTLTVSRNNQSVILTPEQTKLLLLANINAEYRLGRDFEPERYFTIADAPWAGDILLEYSIDEGANWETEVYEAEFDELFEILLENITLIEA